MIVDIANFIIVAPTLIVDPLAAFALIYVLLVGIRNIKLNYNVLKIAGYVIAGGLLAQGYRTLYTILTGESPQDMEMVFWVFKDYGIAIVSFHILWVVIRDKIKGD